MITTLANSETRHTIQGPAGQIELIVSEPSAEEGNAWGVVCHPHPLYGGTMHNKVVTTLAKAYQNMGAATVRFNFRGVMGSEGKYAEGVGEIEDLLAVVAWAQEQKVKKELWLAGFSFGACIAAKGATLLPVARLATIAPPVKPLAMQTLPPITCPWVLVQGEKDDVVAPEGVLEWAEQRDPKPIIIRFPEAGHFFHGQLTELRVKIQEAFGHAEV